MTSLLFSLCTLHATFYNKDTYSDFSPSLTGASCCFAVSDLHCREDDSVRIIALKA